MACYFLKVKHGSVLYKYLSQLKLVCAYFLDIVTNPYVEAMIYSSNDAMNVPVYVKPKILMILCPYFHL